MTVGDLLGIVLFVLLVLLTTVQIYCMFRVVLLVGEAVELYRRLTGTKRGNAGDDGRDKRARGVPVREV